MERSLNRLARLWTYKIQGLAVGAWIGLILLVSAFLAGTDISVDGIVGIALFTTVLAVVLSVWAVAIAAAVFSWKRTYNFLEGHSAEWLSRSIAGVVAIVIGSSALISIILFLLILGEAVVGG